MRALRRTHKVPMHRIRKAVDWLKGHRHTEHPLAEVDLETDGYDIFLREAGFPVSASRYGQGVFQIYFASTWSESNGIRSTYQSDSFRSPMRSPKWVVMDPGIVYGRPTIKDTRITTVMVFERYSGGESLKEIAADYDLDVPLVEEALRCEIEQRAA